MEPDPEPVPPTITIIGDDLTGTAEAAAVFHRHGYAARLLLRSDDRSGPAPVGEVRAVDTDTRQLTAGQAAERAARAVAAAGDGLLVGKLDSLLRGHLVPHLAALRSDRHPVVFTPALPVQGRIVTGGVARDGRPIGGAPLAELLVPLPVELVPALPVPELTGRIAAAARHGRIAVCDATDDADLDRLVAATRQLPGVRYAGAAGLIAALARSADLSEVSCPMRQLSSDKSVLMVVGTAAEAAVGQIERLVAERPGVGVWTWAGDAAGRDHEAGTASAIADRLRSGGTAVLRLPRPAGAAGTTGTTPPDAPRLVAGLARVVERATMGAAASLVLTGGHTARAVLDRLGVGSLTVTGEIHHGAVVARGDGGPTVVTRPGSFGAADSLLRIHDRLRTRGTR